MSIQYLPKIIRDQSKFKELNRLLQTDARSVHLDGVTQSLKATLIATLRDEYCGTLLVITYSMEQAEHLYEDISTLGNGSGDLLLFPSTDGMIYRESDPDFDATGRRLSVLAGLQSDRRQVVVAPIGAVLQRTAPPEILQQHRLSIARTQEVDLDECARRLVGLGYERVSMVEQRGEFSRRGGILDIFSSTEEYPVRIDTFGDEVESICNLDLDSQRSAGERNRVDILPAREVVLEGKNTSLIAMKLGDILLEEGARIEKDIDIETSERLSAKIGDDIIRIRNGAYFDGIEYYLPAVYQQPYCLLDYIPADSLLILDEPHQIETHWDAFYGELLESLHSHIRRGESLALPSEHYVSFDDASRYIKRRRKSLTLSILQRPTEWLEPGTDISISSSPMDSFSGQMNVLSEQIKTWLANNCRVAVVTDQPHRIIEILNELELPVSPNTDLPKPGIYVLTGALRAGFKLTDARLMALTDGEIFGFSKTITHRKSYRKGIALSSVLEVTEGDYVVHINHGIGRYAGLTRLSGVGGDRDYLLIEYSGTDKLYVPTDQIDRIQKYIGGDGKKPTLNKLGSIEWSKTTKRVKKSVREMAKDLLDLYAARQATKGYGFSPDTPWQEEMEEAFPYEETPGQIDAIRDVKQDLETPRPMDRLICGDVGYGKTEVAVRAVFKVVNDGKQAVLLCPTTVLAQQHFNTFRERLAAYPIHIEMLSRFRSRKEQKKVVENLKSGGLDIVIGTHRLLSKDVQFHDLGLVVIDEEHRFGVAHKEKLKQLRKTVDVLTLTATPIPRTLHMSLSGIRDMSLINDPPEGRMPIKTFCREYDDELVRDAILRELDRGGQIYFVHNRIENIEHIADYLRRLVPYAKIGIGHGQMDEGDLEQVMLDFYQHKFDILLCTTIIESGLDIPNVNTIIINRADKMGLAQLYQLRGRVGRSVKQAYSYLLYEPYHIMSEVAEKRLDAIREFTELGSGFKVALRDLEIRGAGNLLGPEQHGQMSSVGFDMYCRLLSEAIGELKGEEVEEIELPSVDLPLHAYIPESYIPTDSLRISFYKKMTAVHEAHEIDDLEEELQERFGPLPKPVSNSLKVLRLRLRIYGTGIASIASERNLVAIKFRPSIRLAPDVIVKLKRQHAGYVFHPDKVIVASKGEHLIPYVNDIIDVLPKALDDSKEYYLAKLM